MKDQGAASNPIATDSTALVPVCASRPPAHPQRAGGHLDVAEDRAWLTPVEADSEKLPGCPSARSLQMAIRDGEIAARPRKARGGGREFHWSSLPREARAEYLARYGVAGSSSTLATVTPEAREAEKDRRADTRLRIVQAADAYIARSRRTKMRAQDAFCELYNTRRADGFNDVDYALEPRIRAQHLRDWSRIERTKGAGALIDGRGRPTGTGFFDKPESLKARNYVIAAVAANGRITARHLCGDLDRDTGTTVALRTMQSFIATIRSANPALLKALHSPDQHRSHHRPAFGTRDVEVINQQWQLDATRADVMCRLANGQNRRMTLTALIDVATRRAMVLVSDEPSAQATQALLRRAITTWGVPATLKTDNGKEFSNRAVDLFCNAAGIKLIFSRPFHPEEKPHVERFFGTLNKTFLPGVQGYVGASIGERKAIEAKKSFAHRFGDDAQLVTGAAITPEGLQARIDAWCRDDYEQHAHDGLKARGITPAGAALLMADQVKYLPDPRTLDQLLMPLAGTRNVLKKGISVARTWYIAAELGAIMGQAVIVRHDPFDLARIFVYDARSDAFVCIAVDPERSGDNRAAIAIGAQRVQRQLVNETRAAVRNVHRLYPPGSEADRRLAHLQGEGFALLPDAAEGMIAAQGPAMIAAARAAEADAAANQCDQPVEATAEQLETATAMIADMTERQAVPQRTVQCDGYTRPFFDHDVDFWLWAERHKASGQQLDAGDTATIDELAASPAFRRQLNAKGIA